jgi:hypothetical protein
MKRRGQIIVILGVFFARCLFVEIGGTVSEATADTATIITDSDLVPSAGDRVEIFFKIPGTDDEVLVGTARVSGIGRGKVGSVREGKGVELAPAGGLWLKRLEGVNDVLELCVWHWRWRRGHDWSGGCGWLSSRLFWHWGSLV